MCDDCKKAKAIKRKNRVVSDLVKAKRKAASAAYIAKNREKKNEMCRIYYAKNAEKYKEMARAYRKANKEAVRLLGKKWREKNADKLRVAKRNHREKNKDSIRVYLKNWRINNRGKVNALERRRLAAKIQRTPAWHNMEAIEGFYRLAQELTRKTGVIHHVDHIVPLRGRLVCGLHVETNLQVITQTENCRKNNRFMGF